MMRLPTIPPPVEKALTVPITFVGVETYNLRFPTSRMLAGSDAMHHDPDYSAAYVILRTDSPVGLEGPGLTYTIGRGNEVGVAGIRALAPLNYWADVRGVHRQHGHILAIHHR